MSTTHDVAAPFELSVSTVHWSPMFGVDIDLDPVLVAAARAGWTRIGLDRASVERYLGSGATLGELRQRLNDLGLTCTDVLVLAIGADRSAAVADATRLAEIAAAVGATIIIAAFARGDDEADPTDAATVETLQACADVLSRRGLRMALEFVAYSPLDTLRAARQLCEQIGRERAGLLVDNWHLQVGGEGRELAVVAELDASEIALVQFSDALASRPKVDAPTLGREHRQVPGDGALDLDQFVHAVHSTGFRGVVAPEVLSNDLRAAPLDEAMTQLRTAIARYWRT